MRDDSVLATYIRALIAACPDEDACGEAQSALAFFLECVRRERGILRYLRWPGKSLACRLELLKLLLEGRGRGGRLALGFLALLLRRGRIAWADRSVFLFQKIRDMDGPTRLLELESAQDLDEKEIAALVEKARSVFFRPGESIAPLRTELKLNPDLISGQCMRLGDLRYDLSARGRYARLSRGLR